MYCRFILCIVIYFCFSFPLLKIIELSFNPTQIISCGGCVVHIFIITLSTLISPYYLSLSLPLHFYLYLPRISIFTIYYKKNYIWKSFCETFCFIYYKYEYSFNCFCYAWWPSSEVIDYPRPQPPPTRYLNIIFIFHSSCPLHTQQKFTIFKVYQ